MSGRPYLHLNPVPRLPVKHTLSHNLCTSASDSCLHCIKLSIQPSSAGIEGGSVCEGTSAGSGRFFCTSSIFTSIASASRCILACGCAGAAENGVSQLQLLVCFVYRVLPNWKRVEEVRDGPDMLRIGLVPGDDLNAWYGTEVLRWATTLVDVSVMHLIVRSLVSIC